MKVLINFQILQLKWEINTLTVTSALHSSDFGSARYGLVHATGRQSRCSQVKKHAAWGRSLHFHRCTMWVQRRNFILNGSAEQSMRRAYRSNLHPAPTPIEGNLNEADSTNFNSLYVVKKYANDGC
jgi:hypothetical protein